MTSYIRRRATLANKYAAELQQVDANPFFRLLATRLEQPTAVVASPQPSIVAQFSGMYYAHLCCNCERILFLLYLQYYVASFSLVSEY